MPALFRGTDEARVWATTVAGPREDDAPQPQPAYPISKVTAERALGRMHQQHGLGLRILRPAFMYGDGDPDLEEGMQWFRGWNPARRLHMVHHADVAQALMPALHSAAGDGQIFNVAGDEPVKGSEIVQHFGESIFEEAAAQPLDDPWAGIQYTTRIRREFGYQPRHPSFSATKGAQAL